MFTGIIEEVGSVIESGEGRLRIGCRTVLEGTRPGDSIAINGVDLTVVKMDDDSLFFDCMPETYRRSNLCRLPPGGTRNLQPSLPPTDPRSAPLFRGRGEASGG